MIGAAHLLATVGIIFLTFAILMVARLVTQFVIEVDRRRRYAQPRMRTRCRMGRARRV